MKRFNITVNGTAYDVQVEEITGGAAPSPAAVSAPAPAAVPAPVATPEAPAASPAPAAPAGAVKVTSPMPGNINDIMVSAGQQVAQNQPLLVLEAMKMENDIVAPSAGTITAIHVNKGDSVQTGTLLVSIS